ncbi:MAG TPA: hypothetical protein PK657_01510 [Legionella sp.]|nr:hypothetical protein [Legionella sp.]
MNKFFVIFCLLVCEPLWALNECEQNVANFTFELAQPFNQAGFIKGWGPKRRELQLSPNNPDLRKCVSYHNLSWQRQRVLAAADYWVKQKLNYCHHYLPDYATPLTARATKKNQGGYCSDAKNIMPGSVYYQQKSRWNYSGKGTETLDYWQNQGMWLGMDCSNYTTFVYNFALGILFSSKTNWQAGQNKGGSQNNLSPNQQTADNVLDNPDAAGRLVCRDNSIEVNHSCQDHGGYISVIDSMGVKHKGSIKVTDLASLPLHPGDLLFIAATRPDSPQPSLVTHVVMWTGKQVGYGPNDINPAQIAPNGLCPAQDWLPKIGDWVITDSHYQGADYRIMSQCFYLNNLWGVRRVLY